MDNVTHSLVGVMLARAFAAREQPATGMMLVAANLPDIDAVSMFGGTLAYLQIHRSYTHSLPFLPLMAIIPPLLFVLKRRISLRLYLLSFAGVLSHLLLDWTNVYGIRLFLPFSSRWLRLDITDIVDPWILLLLLLALAAPALARLVSAEIGSRSGQGPARAWACFALIGLLAFEGVRYSAHQRALSVMGAHLFNGAIARRLTALPSRFRPLEWRGIAEGDAFVALVPVNVAGEFDPTAGRIDFPAEPGPALNAAKATRPFQLFAQFDQLPFWKLTRLPDTDHVELIDLRFGTPEEPAFEASADVNQAGMVLDSQFGFGPPPVGTR